LYTLGNLRVRREWRVQVPRRSRKGDTRLGQAGIKREETCIIHSRLTPPVLLIRHEKVERKEEGGGFKLVVGVV